LLENYITSRNDKAALIIFNTDSKQFTDVIEKAIKTTFNHPLCTADVTRREESSFSGAPSSGRAGHQQLYKNNS
jgi:hypothetical protein